MTKIRSSVLAFIFACASGLSIIPGHGQTTDAVPTCSDAKSTFVAPMGMAPTSDAPLLIVDRGLQAVLSVDPATGDCTVVSSDQRRRGNGLQLARTR